MLLIEPQYAVEARHVQYDALRIRGLSSLTVPFARDRNFQMRLGRVPQCLAEQLNVVNFVDPPNRNRIEPTDVVSDS